MFELAYSSSYSLDTGRGHIMDILEVSRRFNEENDISGCLFCHNDQFTQYLEGDKEIVQELYLKILQDKRHSDVKLLHEGGKCERVFTHWSMVFLDFHNEETGGIDLKLFEEKLSFFSGFAE